MIDIGHYNHKSIFFQCIFQILYLVLLKVISKHILFQNNDLNFHNYIYQTKKKERVICYLLLEHISIASFKHVTLLSLLASW